MITASDMIFGPATQHERQITVRFERSGVTFPGIFHVQRDGASWRDWQRVAFRYQEPGEFLTAVNISKFGVQFSFRRGCP